MAKERAKSAACNCVLWRQPEPEFCRDYVKFVDPTEQSRPPNVVPRAEYHRTTMMYLERLPELDVHDARDALRALCKALRRHAKVVDLQAYIDGFGGEAPS